MAQQETALRRINRWLRGGEGVFTLGGVAGAGKTTLARRVAEEVRGRVVVVAPTNKAASVLRDKGLPQAQTLHSLLYRPVDNRDCDCRAAGAAHQRWCLAKKPRFVLNAELELRGAGLLIVDEASMVKAEDATNLLSFGVPTLVLGDPFQLPPVSSMPYWTEWDYFLDEVHRQARNSPVLRLATAVREGRSLRPGRYGGSVVTAKPLEFDTDDWDQMVVGYNKTRCAFNARYRAIVGFTGELPQPGERVIVRSNDRLLGLINGDLWTVGAARTHSSQSVELSLLGGPAVRAWRYGFDGIAGWERLNGMAWAEQRKYATVHYGYAITCHSAQGSEWPRVIVRNEPPRADPQRWLYTAITRARNRVLISL
jgi:exodeoxyribonuclease-5